MDKTQPVIQAAATTPATPQGLNGKMIGASGTSIMGGIITGEEYNTRLTGKFAIRQYEIMRRSEPSIEGALEIIKQPILNVERSIKKADDSDESDFRARYFERELFHRNIDFQQFSEEALTMLDFGHAVAEFELELTEFEGRTLIGIKNIEFRKQISIIKWETKDGKPGITQQLATDTDGKGTERSIPMVRLIMFANKREGKNYEGISLLRFAFKDWDMKDKLGMVHAVGLEKMAIPTPVLGVPSDANQTEIDAAEKSLRQYRANEEAYIKKPVGWELDKFDMSGQSLKEVLPALQYYDRQIFVSVLAAFFALGASDASGSKAVGQVQYKPYQQKVATINRRFQAPINQFIKALCDVNFTDNSMGYPMLDNARFEDDDMSSLANAVKAFKDAGLLTPTFETEQHVRKIIHFPEAPEELEEDYKLKRDQAIELIKNPPQPTDPTGNPGNDPKPAYPGKSTKASAVRDARIARDRLIDVLVA